MFLFNYNSTTWLSLLSDCSVVLDISDLSLTGFPTCFYLTIISTTWLSLLSDCRVVLDISDLSLTGLATCFY